MTTKVYLFLADGFETIEALAVVDILRRGGIEVKTVSIMGRERLKPTNYSKTSNSTMPLCCFFLAVYLVQTI